MSHQLLISSLIILSLFIYFNIIYYRQKKIYTNKLNEEKNKKLLLEQEEKERRIKERKITESAIFNRLKKEILVYFPNEWTDPVFFIGGGFYYSKDINDYPRVSGIDLLKLNTNKKLLHNNISLETFSPIPIDSVYVVDKEFLEALLKLNPMERWNMSTGRSMKSNIWNKDTKSKLTTKSKIRVIINSYLDMKPSKEHKEQNDTV